jgi:CHAT domain-containing protein/tetratricopeptide (TPR) repeat protein
MRPTAHLLGVLILLAAWACRTRAQPVPAPAGKAAVLTPAEKQLLDQARQLNAEGFRHYQRGDFSKAITLFQEALETRRKALSRDKYPDGHPDLAVSINNLAALHQATGDYGQAELLYREALQMRRRLFPKERFPAGHPDLAISIGNLASLHQAAGSYRSAELLFREALVMYHQLFPKDKYPGGHPDLARGMNNLAGLHQAAGDYGKAEPLLREALVMHRFWFPKERFPNGHPALADSMNNLAGLYKDSGDYVKAEPLFREALAMYRRLFPRGTYPKGHPDLAGSLNNLAMLHRAAGKYASAEPLFLEALTMHRQMFPTERYPAGHPELAMTIDNLALLHQAAGDYARAGRLFREALAMYRRLFPRETYPKGHPDLALSISNLAGLHQAAGDHDKAEPLLREALAMTQQLLYQYAELAAEAESFSFAARQPRTRDALLSNQRHRPDDATLYDALWNGRAGLTRIQERRHRDLMASQDPATAALADQLRLARINLARLLLRPSGDADTHRQLGERLTEAKERLETSLAAKLQLGPLKSAATPTSVKQLRDALPDGTAFVDLLRYTCSQWDPKTPGAQGERHTASYVGFVVRRAQPVARIELGEAKPIDDAWAGWHAAIMAPEGNEKRERAAARAFARLVWEPLRAALPADCRTVYLTPDGALAQVPWAALPGKKSDTVLVDEHAVCLVPHGPWLLERLTEQASGGRKPHVGTLLAYGGIDYQGAPAPVGKNRGLRNLELASDSALHVRAGKRLHWAALPGTAHEQEQIIALAKTALKDAPIARSGRAASTDQLMDDLPKARFAHIATHGFFADPHFRSYLQVDPKLYEQHGFGGRRAAGARSPLVLSGLVLAGANRRGEDAAPDRGIITAESLIGLRMEELELAVLSACDTGLGESGGGEGVFGLQRAFHLAGCKNVIASLWKVDDEATAALMSLFYHHLWVEKKAPIAALRQAQLTLYRHPERILALARERGPDFAKTARLPLASGAASARRSPARLWAGFVLSGAGR